MRPLFDLGQDWTGDGVSLRDQLEAVERQTGRAPDRLAASRTPLPSAFERPMRLWQDLHRGRQAGAMGLAPLSWVDFHAYCTVTGERLSTGDLAAIRIIDEEYIASWAAAADRRAKAKPKA